MTIEEYNREMIGSRICPKCGMTVRVVPGAECLCDVKKRLGKTKFKVKKPLMTKEELEKMFKSKINLPPNK